MPIANSSSAATVGREPKAVSNGERYGNGHPPLTIRRQAGGDTRRGHAEHVVDVLETRVRKAAANANLAAARANAAAANAPVATAGTTAYSIAYEMGGYAVLPAGCISPDVGGRTYYLCGNTWFSPAYGANGVHYRVVPAP